MGSVLGILRVVYECSEYFFARNVAISLAKMSNDASSNVGSWSKTLKASSLVLANGLALSAAALKSQSSSEESTQLGRLRSYRP